MLRMYGLGMGLTVASNQRLAKLRELREREAAEREDRPLSHPSTLRFVTGPRR